MSDDWRIRAVLADHRQAEDLAARLREGDLDHTLASGAAGRVVVSVDEREMFLYADTPEQAKRASDAIQTLSTDRGWNVQTELRRWHPEAEEWEDPDAPLPASEPELEAERTERIAREQAESRAYGMAEYEVRVQCRSHRDTVALADRLRAEGLPAVRRWRFLLVGAADEAAAQTLADRITAEVPPGCTVTVEATLGAIEAETGGNPFAVFGGLGG